MILDLRRVLHAHRLSRCAFDIMSDSCTLSEALQASPCCPSPADYLSCHISLDDLGTVAEEVDSQWSNPGGALLVDLLGQRLLFARGWLWQYWRCDLMRSILFESWIIVPLEPKSPLV